jgi:hypothetical protein
MPLADRRGAQAGLVKQVSGGELADVEPEVLLVGPRLTAGVELEAEALLVASREEARARGLQIEAVA